MMSCARVASSAENGPAEKVNRAIESEGSPLPGQTRQFMESRFGHDFSQVRVHTDERAVESAEEVNALAYTVGQDVVFGQGQYAPETTAGRGLLAHELTHVVQQTGNGLQRNRLRMQLQQRMIDLGGRNFEGMGVAGGNLCLAASMRLGHAGMATLLRHALTAIALRFGHGRIETDQDIVKSLRARNVPAVFGDAAQRVILAAAQADQAALVILAIPENDRARQASGEHDRSL